MTDTQLQDIRINNNARREWRKLVLTGLMPDGTYRAALTVKDILRWAEVACLDPVEDLIDSLLNEVERLKHEQASLSR